MTEQWLAVKTFNDSVLQSLSSGLISVDRKGLITYMNRGAEKILGYGTEEMLGKPLSAAMASKEERHLLRSVGLSDEPSMGRQIRVMRKDGVEIPWASPSRRIGRGGREIGKIIHFRDLTEINEMQEELVRMDRLVSLGEISMGSPMRYATPGGHPNHGAGPGGGTRAQRDPAGIRGAYHLGD